MLTLHIRWINQGPLAPNTSGMLKHGRFYHGLVRIYSREQMENVEFLSRIRSPACRLSGLIRPRLVLWLNIQHIEAHGTGTKFASILPSNLEQRSLKARIVRMGAIIERLQYGPVWLSVRSHGAMKAWRGARPNAGNRNIRLFGGEQRTLESNRWQHQVIVTPSWSSYSK